MKVYKKVLPLLLAIMMSLVYLSGELQIIAAEEIVPDEGIVIEDEIAKDNSQTIYTDEIVEEAISPNEATIIIDDPDEIVKPDIPDDEQNLLLDDSEIYNIQESAPLADNMELLTEETMHEEVLQPVDSDDLSVDLESGSDEVLDLFSMMPLKEENVYLTLNPLEDDLTAFPVSEMLRRLQYADGSDVIIDITPDTCIIWNYTADSVGKVIFDEYHKVSQQETINLSSIRENEIDKKIDMLIGSGEQLDSNMSRYFININLVAEEREQLQLELWKEDASGLRTKVCASAIQEIQDTSLYEDMPAQMVASFENVELDFDQYQYYLGIKSVLAKDLNYDLYVSSGNPYIDFGEQGPEGEWYNWIFGGMAPGTPQEPLGVNCDMSVPGAGIRFKMIDYTTGEEVDNAIYKDVNGIAFYLNMNYVYADSGEIFRRISARVGLPDGLLGTGYRGAQGNRSAYAIDIYQYKDDIKTTVAYLLKEEDIGHPTEYGGMIWNNDNLVFTFRTNQDFDPDEACYMNLVYTYPYPVAIVGYELYEGHYASIEDAALHGTDIKNQADYQLHYTYAGSILENNEFTLVNHSGEELLINIKIDLIGDVGQGKYYFSEDTEGPVIGARDPYFRITGMKLDDQDLDAYVIENGKAINMDTYYGYGYQTVLVNAPLTSDELARLKPVFSTAEYADTRIRCESGSQDIVSGLSEVDFSSEKRPVHFIAIIKDEEGNEKAKNYYVRVISKSHGPKLYVYDGWQQINEDGSSSNVREVMLDEYFEEKHDILIANVGDEPLTGIRVRFTGTGVKLDDYWNIHDNGFNTLSPFTRTTDMSEYGYIDNIAKIRLLPDGTGDAIEGDLIISADGQEDVIIHVSGSPRQPRIVTEKLGDTVKYVPYSFFIATNNMYDWNTQTFHVADGLLPPGMTLYETTGEIYGAPLETGTYTFSIRADFSSAEFEPAEKEFTIVVAANTDENVFLASDEGYAIIPLEDGETGYIGEEVSTYHFVYTYSDEAEVFISEGPLDQFVKIWLNGEVLTPGVDYTYEEGSTKITVPSQVMANCLLDGTNTFAAEFNIESDEKEPIVYVKRTSQNFYFYPRVLSIEFDTNGRGIVPKPQFIREGRLVEYPGVLYADGYDFEGWYIDTALTQPYDFSAPVKSDLKLYARWKKRPPKPDPKEPSTTYETDPEEQPTIKNTDPVEEQPNDKWTDRTDDSTDNRIRQNREDTAANTPKTGDTSPTRFWLILAVLSGVVIVLGLVIRNKKRS